MFDMIIWRLRRCAMLRAALATRLATLRFGEGATVFDALAEEARRS